MYYNIERFKPAAAEIRGLLMKARTIKRHIVELNDNEVKLIYHALMYFENQNNIKNHENVNKIKELRECFYEVINPASARLKDRKIF